MGHRLIVVLAAATLFFAQGVGDAAALGPGAPDSAYGRDGQVTLDISGYEFPTAMAMFPNGAAALALTTSRELVVVKVTPGGATDTAFGSNGVVRPLPGKLAGAPAMFATPEGGLLIVAWAGQEVRGLIVQPHLKLVRLRPNGTRDPRFGQRGLVSVARDVVKPLADHPLAATLMSDGGVVVLGLAGVSLGYFGFPAATGLVRFRPNGHVDPLFGVNGFAPIEVSPVVPGSWLVTTDSRDRVVVGTSDWTLGPFVQTLRLSRFTPRGRPDLTFGLGGVRPFTFGGDWNNLTAVTVDNRDRVLVAGFGAPGVVGSLTSALLRPTEPVRGFTPTIARFTQRGAFDTSFSGDGMALIERDQRGNTLSFSDALTTDEAGRPMFDALAGGYRSSLSLIRLTTSGAVDASFDQPSLPIDSWIRLATHRGRVLGAGYRSGYGMSGERTYQTVIAAYRG